MPASHTAMDSSKNHGPLPARMPMLLPGPNARAGSPPAWRRGGSLGSAYTRQRAGSPALVQHGLVDVVAPDVAPRTQTPRHHMLAAGVEARDLVLVVPLRDAHGRGMDQHGWLAQNPRSLGGGDDEGVGPVDRQVHVEHAKWPADHAGAQVVVHRHRIANGRARVAGRVGPVVERDA